MSSPWLSDSRHAAAHARPFRSIACGVDGTRAGYEAARQAAILASDGAALRLLAVTWETGMQATGMVELARHRAAAALDRARALAHDLGVRAEGVLVDGPQAATRLLAAASGDDLIVVGSSGRSHAGGIVLGHAAAEVLDAAPVSVLVARRPPTGEFPASILVAVDDPAALRRAAEVAGALAMSHNAAVSVLAAPGGDAAAHHAMAEATAAICVLTGVEPVVVDARGKLRAAATQAAIDVGATLIVTAGRHAARAAQCAPCSVLLLRRPAQPAT